MKRPIVWLDPDPLTVEPDELWDPRTAEWVERPPAPTSGRADFATGVIYALLAWFAGLLLGLFIAGHAVAAPRSAAEPVIPTVASGQGIPGASAPAPSGNLAPQPSRAPSGSRVAGDVYLSASPSDESGGMPDGASYSRGRTGDIAWAAEALGPSYLAIPIGPGHRVTICGPAACWTTVSTDAGPNHERLVAGRIADVAVGEWERICGLDRIRGTCRGSWVLAGQLATPPATETEP